MGNEKRENGVSLLEQVSRISMRFQPHGTGNGGAHERQPTPFPPLERGRRGTILPAGEKVANPQGGVLWVSNLSKVSNLPPSPPGSRAILTKSLSIERNTPPSHSSPFGKRVCMGLPDVWLAKVANRTGCTLFFIGSLASHFRFGGSGRRYDHLPQITGSLYDLSNFAVL